MKICLVGCSAKKNDGVLPAGELYCGELFKLCQKYCETHCVPYLILSSCYGCIPPTKKIQAYDLRITQKSSKEKFSWAFLVEGALRRAQVSSGDQVLFLAGNEYFKPLEWIFGPARLNVEVIRPLKGLPIGLQKKWLAKSISS